MSCRFHGLVYRAHNPFWSFGPCSGDGARRHGGRFNPIGTSALYTALTETVALAEYHQGFPHRPQPTTLCAYEVDCIDVADLTDQQETGKLGIDPLDMACAWESIAMQGDVPPSWIIASDLIRSGFAGIIVPSYANNAPANCSRECILEVVGAKNRSLAQDQGDVLAVKLAHLTDVGESNYTAKPGGMDKGYNLVFNNFIADERMDIEEHLVIFSGYETHRPVDCSRRHCEYWYQSTISSAKLNRNIQRMLEQLDIQGNVQFEGNTVGVDRITLRSERRTRPTGNDW